MFPRPAGIGQVILILVPLIAGAAPAAAAEDRPLFPDRFDAAYTQRTYALETAAFNRATLGETYKKVGRRNAKWDAAAEAFLEAVALHWASATVPRQHPQPDWPGLARALELGDAAASLGCDDPLVLYCHARLMREADRPEAFEKLKLACELLLGTQYPAQRRFSAAMRLREQDLANFARHREAIEELAVEMARGPFVNAAHRRTVLIWLSELLSGKDEHGTQVPGLATTRRPGFFARLTSDEKIDPWLMHVLKGNWEIDLAWQRRGGGDP